MPKPTTKEKTLQSIITALFAAIIAVSGFISIPLPGSPVPIVLQNMMPVLAGAILGGLQGGGATGLFLLAGILGLPVFSGGRGGMAHLAGPTGGFLVGYFLAALVVGFYIGKATVEKKTSFFKILIGCFLAFLVIYIPGIAQFMAITKKSLPATLPLVLIPYIPGDLIKLVLTSLIAYKVRPAVAQYFESQKA